MRAFFKGVGFVVGLFFVGAVSLAASPDVGTAIAAALLVIPLVALLKPLPLLGLRHRGFSAAVAFLVGLPLLLAAVGMNAQREKLLALKESDPAAYLAEIRATDQTKWLAELAEIDPVRHTLELERIADEKAQREAALQLAEDARRAERDAAAQALKEEENQRNAEIVKTELNQYIEQIERELISLPSITALDYIASVRDINLALVLIGTWNLLYEEGAKFDLGPDDQSKRQRFKELLIRKQAEIFPALRDAYGPAMRRQLWEADGRARTIGAGYRTVEFVSGEFARNANIAQIHSEMRENLLLLRFTRAQYKWFERASDYSFYTLEPPKDTDLVIWESGGRFRLLN